MVAKGVVCTASIAGILKVPAKSSIPKAAHLNVALVLALVHVHGISTPFTTTMMSCDVNMQLGYYT